MLGLIPRPNAEEDSRRIRVYINVKLTQSSGTSKGHTLCFNAVLNNLTHHVNPKPLMEAVEVE